MLRPAAERAPRGLSNRRHDAGQRLKGKDAAAQCRGFPPHRDRRALVGKPAAALHRADVQLRIGGEIGGGERETP